ncbi:MAG: hypothetical protein WAW39_17105 [Prosthecobacter sp.]|uniref:hypothetical protein n=1 Tax=Prosthecobacter sp. TaxID=1965333 RepID=UPI003BAFCAD4
MTTDHPQHSTNTARRPRNAPELLTRTVEGLQRLAFIKANQETHALHIEPPHAPLLRKAAAESHAFRVRIPQTSTGEAA